MKATEHSAERLIKTLRELPSKQALALRSEVAIAVLAQKVQCMLLQLWAQHGLCKGLYQQWSHCPAGCGFQAAKSDTGEGSLQNGV